MCDETYPFGVQDSVVSCELVIVPAAAYASFRTFPSPEKDRCPHFSVNLHFHPESQAAPKLVFASRESSVLEISHTWNTRCADFSIGCLSLSVVPVRFVHTAERVPHGHFLFMAESYSTCGHAALRSPSHHSVGIWAVCSLRLL